MDTQIRVDLNPVEVIDTYKTIHTLYISYGTYEVTLDFVHDRNTLHDNHWLINILQNICFRTLGTTLFGHNSYTFNII